MRSEEAVFIIKRNSLFGLYNAKQQKIILDSQYTSITHIHDNIYLAIKNGITKKYNSMGDRILL